MQQGAQGQMKNHDPSIRCSLLSGSVSLVTPEECQGQISCQKSMRGTEAAKNADRSPAKKACTEQKPRKMHCIDYRMVPMCAPDACLPCAYDVLKTQDFGVLS